MRTNGGDREGTAGSEIDKTVLTEDIAEAFVPNMKDADGDEGGETDPDVSARERQTG